MSFAAPMALIALLPWAALVAWLWRGRGERAAVPFLHLWPADSATARKRPRRPPPAAVWLMLLALLLAIVAAGRPEVRIPGLARTNVTVIVDRGATMSAGGAEGTRLVRFLEQHAGFLAAQEAGPVPIRLLPPSPADATAEPGELASLAASAGPTAADTQEGLAEAVRQALRDGSAALVISDRAMPFEGRQDVFQIGPTQRVANVAIQSLGVDPSEALLTLSNHGPAITAEVTVGSPLGATRRQIDLAADRQATVSVPLPRGGGDWIAAAVTATGDQWPGDDMRYLARSRAWPDVRVEESLPRPLQRMAEIYRQVHPPRAYSRVIRIGSDPGRAEAVISGASQPAGETWEVEVHALTIGVDWRSLKEVRVADYPFENEAEWRVLVRAGASPVLAARESPRRLWLGMSAEAFEQSPQFVRFWADALTWLNGGPEEWSSDLLASDELAELSRDQAIALVGVEEQEGGPVARNLPPVAFGEAPPWSQADLAAWIAQMRRGTLVAPWLLFGAIMACCAAAWLWPGARRHA